MNEEKKDRILELTNRILDDGTIVDLKAERERNKISKSEQISIGTPVNDISESEDNSTYEAYLKYREENGDLNLKSQLKKVNLPDIDTIVSVFSHENNLTSQSILLAITLLVKPLFIMDINLDQDKSREKNIEIVNQIKLYLEGAMTKIKVEIISRYMNNRPKKTDVKIPKLDEKIVNNIIPFNEMLVNLLLIWLKNTFTHNSNLDDNLLLEDRLKSHIDVFIKNEFNGIFERIGF